MDDALLTCPVCGQASPPGQRFCGACSAPLPMSCPACGVANPAGQRFCGACGTALGRVASRRPASTPEARDLPPSGVSVPAPGLPFDETPPLERRLATILFADLVDSTVLGETLDPEEVHTLFEAAQAALAQTVTRYGGYVAHYLGDGLLALFGAPTAQDADAERAVLAGLQMHQALAVTNENRPAGLPALRMRVGIATGEVIAGLMGHTYSVRGDAANTAARLQGVAVPGGVLVDAATMRLAERRVRFGARQELLLKGKAAPVAAYVALGGRATLVERWEMQAQRTPLVGRGRELGHLAALWQRAHAGAGQLLTVVGDAGVGKSRLLAEALEAILTTEAVPVLRARALSDGQGQSLGLVADLVRGLCGLHVQDSLDESSTRLEATLTTLLAAHDAETQANARDVLGEVVGLPAGHSRVAASAAEVRRHWLIRSLRVLLRALSVRGPVVLVVEDLHWSDADSTAVLTEVLADVPGLRVLVLATQRPGWTAPWSAWGWTERLTLQALEADDTRRLAQAVLRERRLTPHLERHVAERAGGNPFFVEELLRALQEAGDLEVQGETVALRPDAAERLPATLTEVLLARLDRLEPPARQLTQVASVLGRTVAVRLLAQVLDQEVAALEPVLGALQRAEILFPRPSADPEYIFKHAVLREVAYHTLPQQRRRALHLAVARALAAVSPGAESVELIAYHYRQTDEQGAAAHWLEQAGDYAASVYATATALTHYEEARRRRTQLEADALTLARLDEKRGALLWPLSRFPEALEVLEHAAATYAAAGDREAYARVLAQMGWAHTLEGTPDAGIARIQTLLETLEPGQPSRGVAELYVAHSQLYFGSGRYGAALAAAERAAAVARTLADEEVRGRALVMKGDALLTFVGRLEEGRCAGEEAVALLQPHGYSLFLMGAFVIVAEVAALRGAFAASARAFARACEAGEQAGTVGPAFPRAYGAWVAFMQGDWDGARQTLEQAVARVRAEKPSWFAPYPVLHLGRLCLAQGAWAEARAHLQHVVTTAESSNDLQALRGAAGLLAELDLMEGQAEAACARLTPLLDRPGLREAYVTPLLPTLAWAYLEMGQVERAAAVVADALVRARTDDVQVVLVEALRVQALIALRQEHWTTGMEALEEGLRLARGMGYPYAEGRLLHVYGMFHRHHDEPGPARERWEEALTIFRRLGVAKDRARVEQEVQALP